MSGDIWTSAGPERGHSELGRSLTDTPFPDDDGSAAPALRQLLAATKSGEAAAYLRAVAGLCTARLLVPVVATRSTETGAAAQVAADKEADMAVAMLQTGDGRHGLAVFTGMDALTGWNPAARPVPVTLDVAADSARQAQAEAVLIDIGGPCPLVIDGEVLRELAAGHRLVELEAGQFGWAVRSGSH